MSGCLRRVVALCVLVVVAAVAYMARDRWVPQVMSRVSGRRMTTASWQPVTPDGAARVRSKLDTLGRRSGAAYINAAPADVVAYALGPVLGRLVAEGKGAGGPVARAEMGLLLLRGDIRMSDLGGAAVLGPLAGVLEGTQRIEVRGSVEIPEPGRAYFVVSRVAIGDLILPDAALGHIVQQFAPRRSNAQAETAIALDLPKSVADLRVRPGQVTLYRAAP